MANYKLFASLVILALLCGATVQDDIQDAYDTLTALLAILNRAKFKDSDNRIAS